MYQILIAIVFLAVVMASSRHFNNSVVSNMRETKRQGYFLDQKTGVSELSRKVHCGGLPQSCSPGSTVSLNDKDGNELIASDGSSTLMGWNFKVECSTECTGSAAYCIYARRMEGVNVAVDPLTKRALDWRLAKRLDGDENFSADDLCATTVPQAITLVIGQPCYAFQEGQHRSDKPSFIGSASYCFDDQRTPEPCPAGTNALFHRVDRFGWYGRDFSWMTACQ